MHDKQPNVHLMSASGYSCAINLYLYGSPSANPAASSSISASVIETREPLISVSPARKPPHHLAPAPASLPATSSALRLLSGQGGACIDFDLNWATFMVNFTRAASSGAAIHPEPFGRGEMRFFLHWGICGGAETTYMLPRSRHEMIESPRAGDMMVWLFFFFFFLARALSWNITPPHLAVSLSPPIQSRSFAFIPQETTLSDKIRTPCGRFPPYKDSHFLSSACS